MGKGASPTIQTTGHMTHIGDWAIYGDPTLSLKHIEAVHDFLRGKQQEGHSVSLKADGGVSVLFGRKSDGRHFVSYKSGKNQFHTPEEIDAAQVPYGEDIKQLLSRVQEMPLKKGHVFQGDMLWADSSENDRGMIRPNTIKYSNMPNTPLGIAVHGQYRIKKDGSIQKVSSTPDLKQIQHPDVHIPDLQLEKRHIPLSAERNKAIRTSIAAAKSALTPEVSEYARGIPQDKDIHKFLQEYLNEVVATTGKRSVESLRTYIHSPLRRIQTSKAYMSKPTQANLSDKRRNALLEKLTTHIDQNEQNLHNLFQHMNHISNAKHHILDALAERQSSHSITPHRQNEHEGIVSALDVPGKDETLAKLTREGPMGFSAKNRARGLERGFYGPVQEEIMTASSGGVSGMGYNLGGPPPDDVKITPRAQKEYTDANIKAPPVKPMGINDLIKKAIYRKLGRLNVGREAY